MQIYTGKPPFQTIKHDSAVIFRVIRGERPERPTGVDLDDNLWDLVDRCWAQSAEDRPSMDTVIDSLF